MLTAVATLAAVTRTVDEVLAWNVSWTAGAICAVAGLRAAGRSARPEHRHRWR